MHAHTSKKAAEAHFREHKEELRAALKTLDAEDISTTAFYSDHAVTHMIFTLPEDDMDRPGWLRILRGTWRFTSLRTSTPIMVPS